MVGTEPAAASGLQRRSARTVGIGTFLHGATVARTKQELRCALLNIGAASIRHLDAQDIWILVANRLAQWLARAAVAFVANVQLQTAVGSTETIKAHAVARALDAIAARTALADCKSARIGLAADICTAVLFAVGFAAQTVPVGLALACRTIARKVPAATC